MNTWFFYGLIIFLFYDSGGTSNTKGKIDFVAKTSILSSFGQITVLSINNGIHYFDKTKL